MSLLVKINQSDNVAIAVQPLSAGSEVEGIHINQDIPQAHWLTFQKEARSSATA